MKRKKRGEKKIFYIILSIIILIIGFLFIKYNSYITGKAIIGERENTLFMFYLNYSKYPIDGEVSINDVFYGNTLNGNITIPKLNYKPKYLGFKGIYEKKVFDVKYYFPEDYLKYSYVPFVVFSNDLYNDDFYDSNKLHFSRIPITYKIINYCGNIERLNKAFFEFNKSTNGSVYFIPTESNNPDIRIICYSNESENSDYYNKVIGESDLNNIKGNVIINSTIIFYPTISSCGYFPLVEIHELLHSLGYSHRPNISSVMYNTTDNCKWMYDYKDIHGEPRIDDDIILDLKDIYSK